jgi:Na+/phosphate symporter
MRSITKLKNRSSKALDQIPESDLEAGHMYILVIDYLYEMAEHALDIIEANHYHIDNNHKGLHLDQIEELMSLHAMVSERYEWIIALFTDQNDELVEKLFTHLNSFVALTRNMRKNQIKRIKKGEVGTRNSGLYLTHLGELRNLGLFSNRIVRVFDELVLHPTDLPRGNQ